MKNPGSKRPSLGPRHHWPLLAAASLLAVLPAHADITTGLVFHLPLNEGSGLIAKDVTGNGEGGTLTNFVDVSESWTTGRVGGALRFDSSDAINNDVIVVEPGEFYDFAENPVFTIAFWSKAELQQNPEGAGIFCVGVGGGSESVCLDVYQGRYRFFVRNGTNGGATGVHPGVTTNQTWQHIAAVFDATLGTMKLYINGVEEGSATAPTSLLVSADPLDIGARYWNGGYSLNFRGTLDDVRIYDRVLSDADLTELVAAAGTLPLEMVVQPQGTEVTIESAIRLEALADASAPISYQWRKNGEDIPNATNPVLVIPSASAGDAGSYDVVARTSPEASITSASAVVTVLPADISRGLVLHFNFDETSGAYAADSTANENDAELLRFAEGDAHWVPGVVGGALRLNGPGSDDNNLVITEDPVVMANQDKFTFAFWAKPEAYGAIYNPRIFGPADSIHWVLWKPGFGMGIWDNVPTTSPPAVGEWAHYAVLYDRAASNYSVYVNGVRMASGVPAGRAAPGDVQWMVGHHENRDLGFGGVGGGDNFRGTLDEVRMYDRLLAPSEVRALFEEAESVPGWQEWDNGAGDMAWNLDSENWDAGGLWNTNSRAVFGSVAAGNVVVDPAGVTATRMVFDHPGYTISGGPLTMLTVGDPPVHALHSAAISSNIILSGPQSWRVAADKTLTLGNINAGTPTGFGMRGPGTFVIDGSIGSNIEGVYLNSADPTKAVFTKANPFQGVLFLGAGGGATTLEFSAVNQLGSGIGGSYLALQHGSTLRYTGTASEATANRDLYWNAGSATIDIVNPSAELIMNITGGTRNQVFTKAGSGKLTLAGAGASGPLTIAGGTLKLLNVPDGYSAPTTLTAAGSLELANTRIHAVLTGPGTLNVTGGATSRTFGGRIELSGQIHIAAGSLFGNDNLAANWNNNRADLHIEEGGTLDLRGDTITVDALTGGGTVNNSYYRSTHETLTVGINDGSGVFSGTITGFETTFGINNGRISVVKAGSGTQTFTGANSYAGNTTVIAGVLSLARADLDDAATLSISGSGRLNLTHSTTDRVGTLLLDGETQPDGQYGATGSGAQFTTDFITGTGSIRVGAPPLGDGYDAWATSAGIAGEAPGDDFDQDGLSNLMEFAIAGTDPTRPDGSVGTLVGNVLSFTKRPEAVASGQVAYGFEVSTDLGITDPWVDAPATTETDESISITAPAGAPRNFARLKVSLSQ